MSKDLAKKAAEAFASNPNQDKFLQTSDGSCWTNEHSAEQHARTLGSSPDMRKVTPVHREDLEKEIAELNKKPSKAEKHISKMNLEELRSKCTELEIEFSNENKAELLALIEAKLVAEEATENN